MPNRPKKEKEKLSKSIPIPVSPVFRDEWNAMVAQSGTSGSSLARRMLQALVEQHEAGADPEAAVEALVARRVPVVGYIPAGPLQQVCATPNVFAELDYPTRPGDYCLIVLGDSMTSMPGSPLTAIPSGSFALMRPGLEYGGRVAHLQVPGSVARRRLGIDAAEHDVYCTLKRVLRHADGSITLKASNPDVADLKLKAGEFEVLGVFVQAFPLEG